MSGEADQVEFTSLVGLMNDLIEPAAPAPIPLIPQTWGWAVLALILLALAGWGVMRALARHRATAYRRAALEELARATTGAEAAAILRRAALAGYPRAEVAGLVGADWLAFLDHTGPAPLPPEVGAELLAAPWRDETAPPSPALRAALAGWLRGHDPARAPAAREAAA